MNTPARTRRAWQPQRARPAQGSGWRQRTFRGQQQRVRCCHTGVVQKAASVPTTRDHAIKESSSGHTHMCRLMSAPISMMHPLLRGFCCFSRAFPFFAHLSVCPVDHANYNLALRLSLPSAPLGLLLWASLSAFSVLVIHTHHAFCLSIGNRHIPDNNALRGLCLISKPLSG